jgi:hypothetical protein
VTSEGEIAYGAYRAFKEYNGTQVPRWDELPLLDKQAWQHAASEAISVHVAAVLA